MVDAVHSWRKRIPSLHQRKYGPCGGCEGSISEYILLKRKVQRILEFSSCRPSREHRGLPRRPRNSKLTGAISVYVRN